MPIVVEVVDTDFFTEFTNGVGFGDLTSKTTKNLVGSVMENVRASQLFDVSWYFQASSSNKLTVSGSGTVFTRESGSFFDDGFASGDEVYLSSVTNAEITALTETTMTFATPTGISDNEYEVFTIAGKIIQTALFYGFGLIENSENFNTTSKVTENQQGYYVAGINPNFEIMEKLGDFKGWQTGTARVRRVSIGGAPFYKQRFLIDHDFTIVPYYLNGELVNLQNNLIPALLDGQKSLKYVFEPKFRTVLSNPNTEKSSKIDNNLGFTAWFNESGNGTNNNYQVNSIIYQDANSLDNADGLLIGSKTKVTIEVESLLRSFGTNERAGVYVSYLPTEEEYVDTVLTNQKQNFIYDNALNNGGLSAEEGQVFITNFEVANISGSTMDLTFDVEYDNLTKAFLSNKNSVNEAKFLIGVQLGDISADAGNMDKVMILADVKDYDESADIPDLIVNTELNFFPYPILVGADTGYTSLTQWNEDGFTIEGKFDLDLSKDSYLNTLECKLIAENTVNGRFFELDTFTFNVSNTIVQNGVQQINFDSGRNYNLQPFSQFNEVSLNTGIKTGDLQTYDLRFSQKIKWQDWIVNNFVDSVFYDATKPNNNLNFKTSNYSELNDYEIKIGLFANVSGVNVLGTGGDTDYNILTPSITVYDYDKDGNVNPEWVGTIQTFDSDNLTDLSGTILTSKNTLFRITWVNTNGAVTEIDNFTAIHRIEESNQNGDNIDELGTLYSFPTNNRVIPKELLSNLDLFLDSGNVVTECLIDASKLQSGLGYNISGKIELEGDLPTVGKLTSPNNDVKNTSGTIETKVLAE